VILAFQCFFSETGSISAPGRKVSRIEPTPARKVVKPSLDDVLFYPRNVPETAPTRISTRATETLIRMLMNDASSAIPSQIAAMLVDVHVVPPGFGRGTVLSRGPTSGVICW